MTKNPLLQSINRPFHPGLHALVEVFSFLFQVDATEGKGKFEFKGLVVVHLFLPFAPDFSLAFKGKD
jgi:hypothetical protein